MYDVEEIIRKGKEIEEVLLECLVKAEEKYKRTFEWPTVDFKLRGKVAGKAYYKENRISLNRTLMLENDNFIQQTLPHELAHLICYQTGGHFGHGGHWQLCMIALGRAPKRCHNYDVRNTLVGGAFVYECDCEREHVISKIKHNRILKGREYFCKFCRQPIRKKGD